MGAIGAVVPQVKIWALVVPVYTAPARVKFIVNVVPLNSPETHTSHGPLVHLGASAHVSVSVSPTGCPPAPPVRYFMSTVHDPCKRASEMGGVRVLATSAEEDRERTVPETATTLYRYAVAGLSPLSW
jgi:hypothetical protein